MTEDSDEAIKKEHPDRADSIPGEEDWTTVQIEEEDENGYLKGQSWSGQNFPSHILQTLAKPDISLNDACWLFAGFGFYSPEPMHITRLADHKSIPFGHAEYRGALAEHDRIFKIIMSSNHMLSWQAMRRDITEGEAAWKKARFDTMWVVDLVANHLHDYQRIHIPWLKRAYDLGYIPGTIIRPPRIVDSGKLAILSSSSAELTEVWIESTIEIKFTVNTLQKELDSMRMWVYKELVKLSAKGEKRPSRNELIEIIKEQCPIEHSVIAQDQIIKYTKDGDSKEYRWSYEAIKQFLLHHTEERKTSPSETED